MCELVASGAELVDGNQEQNEGNAHQRKNVEFGCAGGYFSFSRIYF